MGCWSSKPVARIVVESRPETPDPLGKQPKRKSGFCGGPPESESGRGWEQGRDGII